MKRIIKYTIITITILIIIVLSINFYVVFTTKGQIITSKSVEDLTNTDCILILGAGVKNGHPTPMLEDRLKEGLKLYQNKVSNKIIVSGDHGQKEYDEVNIMKQYLIDNGVPSEDIFMDHAGFSTYDSIYRAKEIFKVKKMIIVTQDYHLYRSLYIANALGIQSHGKSANPREYSNQIYRDIREILARNKDFVKSIIKPKPSYLGETIPVNGNGDVTNDKVEIKKD